MAWPGCCTVPRRARGHICENLPETHDVIRAIRRHIDTHYANRMLLAEANQVPADVRVPWRR